MTKLTIPRSVLNAGLLLQGTGDISLPDLREQFQDQTGRQPNVKDEELVAAQMCTDDDDIDEFVGYVEMIEDEGLEIIEDVPADTRSDGEEASV